MNQPKLDKRPFEKAELTEVILTINSLADLNKANLHPSA